ncbi:MAG: hypothetical protein ACOY5S_04035 [Pseudomonadota bacterium]
MRTRRPTLSRPLKTAWHVLLVASGWVVFGMFWWIVMPQDLNAFSSIARLIAVALFLLPAVTFYWVMHNRGIYDRKGPRRHVQRVTAPYPRDWAGRKVRADFEALRQVREITIIGTAEEKHYVAGRATQPYSEAA